ncbi:MAG: hypothetical protein ABIH89_07525 [Elusimicrobiota bacterium]
MFTIKQTRAILFLSILTIFLISMIGVDMKKRSDDPGVRMRSVLELPDREDGSREDDLLTETGIDPDITIDLAEISNAESKEEVPVRDDYSGALEDEGETIILE